MKLIILLIIAGVIYWVLKHRRGSDYGMPDIKVEARLGSSDDISDYKRYNSIDDWKKDLKVLWQGQPRRIEFTYESKNGEKTRRKVDVRRVVKDDSNRTYLQGFCFLRKEYRTFLIDNITTKILDKSQRYEVIDWMETKLGIE